MALRTLTGRWYSWPMTGADLNENAGDGAGPKPGLFPSTHWSVVLAAGQSGAPGAEQALETLCRSYWRPIYAYIRHRGHDPYAAQDLTQEFFGWLLQKEAIARADRAQGKFRTFLLTLLDNFLVDEYRKATRQKRGGGQPLLSLEAQAAEEIYKQTQPAGQLPPDKVYDRHWALSLIERALNTLRNEYVATGRTAVFDALKDVLWGHDAAQPYAQMAGLLGLSEGALKVAAHRLRKRCAQLLRTEVAQTVADPADVEEELRYLLRVSAGYVA